jgi:DNA-3-methyladenine glycosylase II
MESAARTIIPTTFELSLDGPLDIPRTVERFRRWGDDLLDRWDGTTLLRTTRIAGAPVPYALCPLGTVEAPRMEVMVADPAHRAAIEREVRAMFVAAPAGALDALAARDPVVAGLAERHLGVRPILISDGLAAIIRSISAQQVNLTWAATTRRRLAEAYGERHTIGEHVVYSLGAARLAAATVADLRTLQFTTRKAEYIIATAQAILAGDLDLDALESWPDAAIVERLVALRGIGRWTAEWYLARTLGRPVVVAGDLGVRKAVGRAYLDGAMPSEERTRELTAHWGAAAGVVQELALFDLNADQSRIEAAQAASPQRTTPVTTSGTTAATTSAGNPKTQSIT